MAHIKLKTLLGKNKETTAVVTDLIAALGTSLGIFDNEGRLLVGEANADSQEKYPVILVEEMLGWVSGGGKAEPLANLLTHLANREAEKKNLGNEVLGLYRETNLIYNFSEKLVVSLEVSAIAGAALEQARQLIKTTGGAVMLLNEETRVLDIASAFGQGVDPSNAIKLGEGIVGRIAATGNAEIVNEVLSDKRHIEDGSNSCSLLCAPLKIKEQVKGVLVLMSDTPLVYTAAELKLLIAIASQTALAVENALLHEKMVREATRKIEERRRELEVAVQERTMELARQKENIEQLSEIGKEITASLDMDTIFYKLYEHVNQLVEATIFGVGIFHPEKEQIEFSLAMENGKRYAPYSRDMGDKNQLPVWCVEHRKPIFINDIKSEYTQYISEYKHLDRKLEDGTTSASPSSMIYLPLISQDKVLGVIAIQSLRENAYTAYHLNLLQNLAAYTSIALDNADAYHRLDATLQHLQATQQQLVTQQKLASLGQLTAGIAHEIQNPLNFVNNFSEVSAELIDEIREEISSFGAIHDAGKIHEFSLQAIFPILDDIESNLRIIHEQGSRADSIVKSMLMHSRGGNGEIEPTHLNSLVKEYTNLAYHGMMAGKDPVNVDINLELDENIGDLSLVAGDFSRVILNLCQNAFDAMRDKTNSKDLTGLKNLTGHVEYKPRLIVRTKSDNGSVMVQVEDNGPGIPEAIRDKILQPFFTTKKGTEGTGLGLSITHDIVKAHGGEVRVETKVGTGSSFIILLPSGKND